MAIRKAIVILALFLWFPSMTSSVWAQTASESGRKTLEARREEVKTRRETLMQQSQERKEAAMTGRLKLQDSRKDAILERIAVHIAAINERITDHFLRVLDRLEAILAKIRVRTEKIEGEDVTSVLAAITAAEEAIVSAENVVTAQKAKVYAVNVSDEATARNEVQTMMATLRADLKKTKESVEGARRAVHAALQALRVVISDNGNGGVRPTLRPSTTAVPAL